MDKIKEIVVPEFTKLEVGKAVHHIYGRATQNIIEEIKVQPIWYRGEEWWRDAVKIEEHQWGNIGAQWIPASELTPCEPQVSCICPRG